MRQNTPRILASLTALALLCGAYGCDATEPLKTPDEVVETLDGERSEGLRKLDEALAAEPSVESFQHIIDLFEAAAAVTPTEVEQKWLPRAESKLQDWPPLTRAVRPDRIARGDQVWIPLIRTLAVPDPRDYPVIWLKADSPGLAEALRSPAMANVTHLDLHGARFFGASGDALVSAFESGNLNGVVHVDLGAVPDASLVAIAESGGLRSVEYLSLEGPRERALTALLRSEDLRGVKSLRLHGHLGAEELELLAKSPAFQTVETLEIVVGEPNPDAMNALLQVDTESELKSLRVECRKSFEARAGVLHALVSSGERHASLERLELLGACDETPEDAKAFAEASQFDNLVHLELMGNRIGDVGLTALLTAEHLSSLQHLGISGTGGDGTHVVELLESADHLTGLKSLDISNQMIRTSGLIRLSRTPHISSVRKLEVGGAGLDGDYITPLLAFGQLRHLDLSSNVPPTDTKLWAKLLTIPTLKVLSIAGLGLGDDDVAELVKGEGAPISVLDVSANAIGDRGVEALAKSDSLRSLRQLNLMGNRVGTAGVDSMREGALVTQLEFLSLSQNPLEDPAKEALGQYAEESGLVLNL